LTEVYTGIIGEKEKGEAMRTIIAMLIIGVVIASCVGMESSKNEPKRYLQIKNPMNSEIVMQMEFLDELVCQEVWSAVRDSIGPQKSGVFQCNHISASSSLPYTMRVVDKATNTIFTVETITHELCVKGYKDFKDVEILIPCSLK
jgi:hypothetical protein